MISFGLGLNLVTTGRVEGDAPIVNNNLLPNSEDAVAWMANGASVNGPLNLNALGQFSGYEIVSGGATWHRRLFWEDDIDDANTYWLTLYVRAGTSGKIRVHSRDLNTNTSRPFNGTLGALPAVDGGMILREETLQPDGLTYKIVLESDLGFTGPVAIGVGPDSPVSGETLIVLGLQFETGPAATPYQKTP